MADRGAFSSRGGRGSAGGADGWAPDDRGGDLCPDDGAQAALSVGVSDAGRGGVGPIHLRRFCRISLSERVPDESTVRKLTRRIGSETVSELTRALIVQAVREKRFRPRAVRIDSTVVDADVKHPTHSGLASSGVTVLAREGRKLAKLIGEKKARVRDRSRSMGRKLRAITRMVRRRSGEAKQEVLKLTERTGELLGRFGEGGATAREDRSRQSTRSWREGQAPGGRVAGGDGRPLREGRRPDPPAGEGRADQGQDRVVVRSGRPADPQGKLGKPYQFGFVSQLAEVTEHTQRGARGLILPAAATEIGNPAEDTLLPATTIAEMKRLGIRVQEVVLDGGINVGPTSSALEDLQPKNVSITGRQEPGSKRTQRRMRRYRTGAEGRISHLKRRYGRGPICLKGDEGRQIWTEWSILADNADTLTVREQ